MLSFFSLEVTIIITLCLQDPALYLECLALLSLLSVAKRRCIVIIILFPVS